MSLRSLVREVFLVALPDGGQATARQNAWRGMSDDAARARARRDARAALAAADRRARRRSSTGS